MPPKRSRWGSMNPRRRPGRGDGMAARLVDCRRSALGSGSLGIAFQTSLGIGLQAVLQLGGEAVPDLLPALGGREQRVVGRRARIPVRQVVAGPLRELLGVGPVEAEHDASLLV